MSGEFTKRVEQALCWDEYGDLILNPDLVKALAQLGAMVMERVEQEQLIMEAERIRKKYGDG